MNTQNSSKYDATKDVHSEQYEGDPIYVVAYLVIAILFGGVLGIGYYLWL